MKKFLVLMVVFLFVCVSGCSSNISSNSINSSTTTTTVPTTLSEEEILNNRIKDINESVIESLKDEYNFLDAEYLGYINFQDYIRGAESNPSEYFFIGTTAYDLSTLYDNTKFYKNSDALEQLKEWDVMDADYLFIYQTTKKDTYGKEKERASFVLVRENDNDTGFHQWIFDSLDDDYLLGWMIMTAISDKCEFNH